MRSKFINKIEYGLFYFLLKLCILSSVLFIIDFGIGNILRHYYFKQQVGRLYRATYAIDKTTDQVLIFGSSRAYHHYMPSIIEEKLKMSCYNVGFPGQLLIFNYATLKAILKRYNPKMIVLDLMPGELRIERASYDRLSYLLPYYKEHPEIHPIIKLRGPYEKYKLISSIYPFNSLFLMIAGGNLEYFKKSKKDEKGFVALTNKLNSSIEINESSPYDLDSTKINILKSFIKICIKSKVNLVISCSPSFINFKKQDFSIQIAKDMSKLYGIPFFDYSNDTTFLNDCSLFDDPGHLNKSGAIIFSNLISSRLMETKF